MPPFAPTTDTHSSSFSPGFSADFASRAKTFFFRNGFAGLVVVGILARLVFVLIPGNALKAPWSGGGDTGAYVLLAQNIVAHRGFTYAGQPTAFRPPGYPLLLAAFMEVFGKNYVLATRVLQFFEGLFVALLCAAIARTIFGKRAAKATLVIALFLPTLVQMTGEVLTEATAATLTVVFLYFLVQRGEDAHGHSVAGMSVAVGLGAMVRSNLAFLGCVSLWAVFFRQKGRLRLRDAALAVLVPCVLMTPWVWRNLRSFNGSVVFSTQAGFAAMAGVMSPQGRALPGEMENMRAALGWALPSELETNSSIRSRLPTEPEIDRRCWQVTFRVWRETGWRLVLLTLEKLSYFWFSTDQLFGTSGFSRPQRVLRATGVLVYWVVLLLGVVGWVQLRATKSALAQTFLIYALLVTLLHIPFNMNTRYRITFIDPVLVVLGGNAAIALTRRWLCTNDVMSLPLNAAPE